MTIGSEHVEQPINTGAYSSAMAEKGDTALMPEARRSSTDDDADLKGATKADATVRGAADEQATKAPLSI